MVPAAIALAVWEHRLSQITEEMGTVLRRSALSPNIKERRDYSCAFCDECGQLVAQAAHIPVHLGSTALAVQAVRARLPLGPEDIAIVNDPYAGGTHLPDVTLVAPAHAPDGSLLGYLAVRAHHADVGGALPGSGAVAAHGLDQVPEAPELPPAPWGSPRYPPSARPAPAPLTLADEGVCLPPTLLTEEVERGFAGRGRNPQERLGDLRAQRAALVHGRRLLAALAGRHGADTVRAQGRLLQDYAARMAEATLRELPAGVYAFADSMDDDGAGTSDVAIRVLVTLGGGRATVDFSESDDEVPGAINAVWPVTVSAVLYAFRLLMPADLPTNAGCLRPLTIVARAGSIVNARPPRAVSAGNTETSQRIVDVVLGALAQALPQRVPAASSGTMNNLMIGNADFVYYETIAGGAGATPTQPGARAIHTHMTNTLNTPAEALEHAAPLRVLRYALRRGSGGAGTMPGGDGVVREIELLEDATVTLLGERRRRPPYGLRGGGPGLPGKDTLRRGDRVYVLPAKVSFAGRAGDVLTIETPGGGGSGDAGARDFGLLFSQAVS